MRPDDNRGGGYCEMWNFDTLQVRFVIESDDVETGKAGWMIRNIVPGGSDIGGGITYLENGGWSIAPNPAESTFQIQAPTTAEVRYSLIDLTGRRLVSGNGLPCLAANELATC